MPHRVNEDKMSKKFKACFSENCFPIISCGVFSDPTNKLTSCLCCLYRSLSSRSTSMAPADEGQGPAFHAWDNEPIQVIPALLKHTQSPNITSWSGTEFSLVQMLTVPPQSKHGNLCYTCLLSAHIPSFLVNNHKFPHPFVKMYDKGFCGFFSCPMCCIGSFRLYLVDSFTVRLSLL